MTEQKKASFVDDTHIRHLADLLHETGLSELEIESDNIRVRLRRETPPMQTMMTPAPVVAEPAPPQETAPSAGEKNALTAPLVGTFYHSPSPDAAPFIKVGDTVKEGQVIGIIEAMKTMNNVEADRNGTVVKFLTADAQPVEFGQPLLIIE